MNRAIWLALVLSAAACRIGPSVQTFPPAHEPGGARIRLTLRKRPALTGELLVVQDSALLVRRTKPTQQVLMVPLRLVVYGQGPSVAWSGKTLEPGVRERLRLLSRFPYGLAQERLRALLTVYGQDSVEVVR